MMTMRFAAVGLLAGVLATLPPAAYAQYFTVCYRDGDYTTSRFGLDDPSAAEEAARQTYQLRFGKDPEYCDPLPSGDRDAYYVILRVSNPDGDTRIEVGFATSEWFRDPFARAQFPGAVTARDFALSTAIEFVGQSETYTIVRQGPL